MPHQRFQRFDFFIVHILGADVGEHVGLHGTFFRYPSYVQEIMGDIFSLGFGPFRSVVLDLKLILRLEYKGKSNLS